MRIIACISRPTLDPERTWSNNIDWAIKRLRGYLWDTKSRMLSDHKALESISKMGDHNARVQRWIEFITKFDYTLECRKDSANRDVDCSVPLARARHETRSQ